MSNLILGGKGYYLTENQKHTMRKAKDGWRFFLHGRYAGKVPRLRAARNTMDALIELQEARPGHKWKWSVEYGFQCEACGRPANKLGVVCK